MLSKKQQIDELRLARLKRKVEALDPQTERIFYGMMMVFHDSMYLEYLCRSFLHYTQHMQTVMSDNEIIVMFEITKICSMKSMISSADKDYPQILDHFDAINNLIIHSDRNDNKGSEMQCPKCKQLKPYATFECRKGKLFCDQCHKESK